MRIGYVRAARLVDHLEAKGIVGPTQGSSPREVLVGINDLERILRSRVPAGTAAQGAQGAHAAASQGTHPPSGGSKPERGHRQAEVAAGSQGASTDSDDA